MASATVSLGIDNSGFLAGLNEASRSSAGFERNLAGLFRRSPFTRAERSFAELAANLSTGNVAQGLGTFASRITGLGLGMAVAIGAGVALFQKLSHEIKATDASALKLGNELATLGGTRSPEKLHADFQSIVSETEDLIKKSDSLGDRGANFLDKFINPLLGTSSRGRGNNQSALITAGLQAAGATLDEEADAEQRLVAIKREGLSVSSEQAAVDKITLAAAVKKSSIDEAAKKFKLSLFDPALKDKLSPKARDKLITASDASAASKKASADEEANIDVDIEHKKFALQQAATNVAQQEADLEAKGVSASARKIAHLKNELSLIQQKVQWEKEYGTVEERAATRVQLTKAQTALREAQFEQVTNPSQAAAEAGAAAVKSAQMRAVLPEGFSPRYPGDTVHRGMNGNVIPSPAYQTSPDAYNQTGGPVTQGQPYQSQLDKFDWHMPPPTQMNQGGNGNDIAAAIDKLSNKMDQYWQ